MKRKLTYVLVTLVCVALLAAVTTTAWLSARHEFGKEGSVKDGYFAAGDGSAGDPYIITDEYHMYNLAWLHYYGYFKDRFPYFKVQTSATDDAPAAINMAGLTDDGGRQLALPPIGTELDPFCGQFNGNRSTISNLVVSVAAADISADGGAYDFGSNLGMFGTVKAPTDATAVKTKIYDFNLDGITVETKTFDNLTATDATPSVGLVAGNADPEAVFEHVGVVKGKITAAANNKFASRHALIGSVGDDTGGGSGEEGGNDLIIDPNAETNGFIGLNGESYGDTLSAGGDRIARVTDAKDGNAYYSTGGNSMMSFIKGDSGDWYHPYRGQNYLDLNKNLYTLPAADTPEFTKMFPNGNSGLSDEETRIYQMLDDNVVAKYGQNGTVGLANQKVLFSVNNGLRKDNLISGLNNVSIPKGGVYFKPMFSGTVSALVYVPNPSNFSVGLFKLRRPAENDFTAVSGIERVSEFVIEAGRVSKITAPNASLGYDNALELNGITATQIANQPSGGFYFLFEEQVNANEEYVIGQSQRYEHLQTTFVYLVLPSVNEQGGSGITGMDFITADSPMWTDGYFYSGTNAAVTFDISGTATADGFTVWFIRNAPGVLYYAEGADVTVTPSEADKSQSSADAKYDAVRASFADGSPPGHAPPQT